MKQKAIMHVVLAIFVLGSLYGCTETSQTPPDSTDPPPAAATGDLEIYVVPSTATVEVRAEGSFSVARRLNGSGAVELEVGTYEVTAEAEGYLPSEPIEVEVVEGQTVSVTLSLEPVPTLIDITRVTASAPNYVGGVDITISYVSRASQTIDYVRFRAEAYNAVGDRVYDDFDRSIYLRDTGPLSPGQRSTPTWTNVIYNYSAECFQLTSVEVELRDDTIVTYDSPTALDRIMSTPNQCLPQ